MADKQVVNTTSDTAEQPAELGTSQVEGTVQYEEGTQNQTAQTDRDKARLKNALAGLQAKVKDQAAKLAAYEQFSVNQETLEPDEDGTVAFKGANIPAELAKELMELRSSVGEIATSTNQKEISQIEQQIAEAETGFQQAFIGDVVSARKSAFPNLDGAQATFVDRLMVMAANEQVGEQRAAGVDLLDIDFTKTISSVLTDFKSTFGSLAEQQMNDNNNYRQTSAPKSNGMGGTNQPVAVKDMTRQQRAEHNRTLQMRAEELSKA